MAIVKNNFRVSRVDGNFSLGTVSSEEDEECYSSLASSIDAGSASDADSGMGSDEIDISEFGEPGMEFCQVGNQSCGIPLELYDLPDLGLVLSLETWNDCLTEEERFSLAEYLPDMEQEGFALNLKELLCGQNFHFGNPVMAFFNMLRGGLCDPRVLLYRQGLNLFQRRQYYHWLRKYQNSMVENLVQMRDIWLNCNGYGIEERLRVLNNLRGRGQLSYDKNGDLGSETNSESGDSSQAHWNKRFSMDRQARKPSRKIPSEVFSHGGRMELEPASFGKEKSKGILKVSASKGCKINRGNYPILFDNGTEKKAEMRKLSPGSHLKTSYSGYDLFNGSGHDDWNAVRRTTMSRSGSIKSQNKKDLLKRYDPNSQHEVHKGEPERLAGLSDYHGRGRISDQKVTIASYDYDPVNSTKKLKNSDKNSNHPAKIGLQRQLPKLSQGFATTRIVKHHKVYDVYDESVSRDNSDMLDDQGMRGKKWKAGDHLRSGISSNDFHSGEPFSPSEYRTKISQGKLSDTPNQPRTAKKYSSTSPIYAQSEETESDSSNQAEEDGGSYPYACRSEFPTTATEARKSGFVKTVHNPRKLSKSAKFDKKDLSHPLNGGVNCHDAEAEPCRKKFKQKGKSNLRNYSIECKSLKKHQTVHLRKELQPTDIGSNAIDTAEDNFDSNTNKNQIPGDHVLEIDHIQSSNIPLMDCPSPSNNISKEEDRLLDDSSTTKKKGKRKADTLVVASLSIIPEAMVSEKGASDLEPDMKLQRKSFTPITPTIHTGFSFSVIHLLSAIRKALVSPPMEDNAEIGNHLEKTNGEMKILQQIANGVFLPHSQDHIDGSILELGRQTSLPSLTIQETVNRVRSNPGDPCILETQEPLQDLIRGALRIFSSRTAPLGAKNWKALVSYDKSSKSWTWVGPLSTSLSDNDIAEETSAENWGIPHKMLVKLVDAFANWLKSGQETLQQIGSLPAPPPMLPVMDEKERFRDLRAQKSLNTIRPSSDEVRAYFRKEELLRYSIPDRAFQYTAFDGRKSIVAPLRRGGGKPTSKARDHFMLKPDRPPHVTVLCLVRDAAARLPGSVGTRADVCTLIRDSQYIVEDVTDAQINQVVSGALDRLHYERDPCVQFDGDRKLWVYLHRDREDEDFEDDGTSSTKKWKRQRKDVPDNTDMAAMNDSNYLVNGDLTTVGPGYDYHPDLNVDSSAINTGGELVYSDLRPTKENFQTYINTAHSERRQENTTNWEVLGVNHLLENKMLCQENSTNDDFDDEPFGRERAARFLGGSLL